MIVALRAAPRRNATTSEGATVPAPVPVLRRPLPAWPVDALLWGFPLWWLLGLIPFIVVILGAVMAALLLVRRGLELARGAVPFLFFLVWLLPCALMLNHGLGVFGFAQRVGNYAAIGVVLLYVVNARERLPARRLVAGLVAVWFTVLAGGYLGLLIPDGRLTTPVGLLLPDAITSNQYVHDLVSPPFAEVQQPWGAVQPYVRPSAPFPYTNSWGAAVVLLTPAVLAQLALSRSPRTRVVLVLALLAAIVPATQTLNRGMLVGLGVCVCYVAVRLAFRGRGWPFLALTGLAAVAAALAASSGLLDAIAQRADYGSTEGRGMLYSETFERTLHSPLFGYGAPRPSAILDISDGTQGFVWTLMFCYGFVGLALFLWYLFGAVVRTWRARDTPTLWLHAVLVATCAIIVFYGLGVMQLLTVVLVSGLLFREPGGIRNPGDAPGPAGRSGRAPVVGGRAGKSGGKSFAAVPTGGSGGSGP